MPKIRTCARLTALVITATHKPARTPMPIASAVMPNSLARNLERAVASAISAGRGTETNRARRRTGEPIVQAYARRALLCQGRLARRPVSESGKRHVVAMNHFGAACRPENMGDIARITAADALRMQRVIGNEP